MAQVDITEQPVDNISIDITQEEPDASIPEIGRTAGLVAIDQDKDPVEAYVNATQTGDLGGMLNTFTESVTEDRTAMMNSFVGINPPETIQKDVEDFQKDMSGESGILGPLVQQIKTMPSSVGKTDEQIRELAAITLQRHSLAQFQPTGFFDGLGDFAGVLVPKRKAATVREVASKLGFVKSVEENVDVLFDPTDELDQMRNIGLNLHGEEKAKYIKDVVEAVSTSSDNNFIKSSIVDAIFGEGTHPSDTVFEMIDLAAVTQLAAATMKVGSTLFKAGSALNMAKKMEAPEVVAEMVVRAGADEATGVTMGVSKADVGDTLNPLINGEMAKLIEGASEDLTAQTVHMLELQDLKFKELMNLSREGVLDKETASQVMRAAEIEQMKQPGVVSAKITKNDETGFTLQYAEQRFDEAGQPLKSVSGKPFVDLQTKQVDFQLSDMGKMESPIEEYSTTFNKLDFNARMSGRLRNWYVSTIERLDRMQSKTAFNFDRMMIDAFKGLKGSKVSGIRDVFGLESISAAKVDYAIMQGAKEGTQYNLTQLMDVGVGANKVKLSSKEAKAYIGVRNIVAHMHSMKNKQISDGYLSMGVKLIDGVEGSMAAKTFDSAKEAMSGWKSLSSDSRWINVLDDGLKSGTVPVQLLKFSKKGELTEELLEEAYEAGYVLAKNHASASYFKRGKINTQWALVKRESVVSPRGQQVINKIPGYMPKQRTNGYFFIKSNKAGVLSGASKDFRTGQTVAWSDSSKSADDWIAAQDDPSKFIKVFDRELTPEQQVVDIASTHGGMYSGARKSTELPFVGESKAEFADSFEAMQHYINHIGRQYPASLYRLGSEQRMLEIAESIGVKGATGLHNVLQRTIDSGFRAPTAGIKGSKQYEMMKDIHDQVSFINMIPTEAEMSWATRFEEIGKALEGPILNKIPGWSKVPKFFYNKASASTHPADLIRGFTFNHLLGMYNPAQILVQFSGAMVSFAVSPVHFARTLPKSIAGWPMLDLAMSDPAAQARMLKWMRTKGGMKEFAEDYELWAKSGYRESVINGNADYTSVFMKNLPYDSNILQKAMFNHTVFYKMGELANTRTAFATAIERYKDLKKIKHVDPNDADALEAISIEAEALRLNMSRANQSDLNKGWKSVPLQFQQVIAKYIEKVMPKGFGGTDEFTGWEKMRLAALPTVMTGTVGVPAGQWVSVKMLDMMGVDETDLSPGEAQNVKFGAIGWMMGEALDINVDLSSRMTLGGDVLKKSFEVFTGSRSFWQWLGPSSSVLDRYFRNGQHLAEAFDLSVLEQESVDIDTMKFMAGVLRDIAIDIPSVGRNIKQYSAYLLTHSDAFVKDGKYIFDLETMNERTALFGMFGFQPQEISEIYEIDKEINDGRSAFQLFGDTDSDIIRRVLSTHLLAEDVSIEHQEFGAKMINAIMRKYGPMEAAELMNQIWEKANSKRFDQDDLLIKFLLESEKRMQEGLDVHNVMISRKLQALREKGRIE